MTRPSQDSSHPSFEEPSLISKRRILDEFSKSAARGSPQYSANWGFPYLPARYTSLRFAFHHIKAPVMACVARRNAPSIQRICVGAP